MFFYLLVFAFNLHASILNLMFSVFIHVFHFLFEKFPFYLHVFFLVCIFFCVCFLSCFASVPFICLVSFLFALFFTCSMSLVGHKNFIFFSKW